MKFEYRGVELIPVRRGVNGSCHWLWDKKMVMYNPATEAPRRVNGNVFVNFWDALAAIDSSLRFLIDEPEVADDDLRGFII